MVHSLINVDQPRLSFSSGVPASGWLIPKPNTVAWGCHSEAIKAWLDKKLTHKIILRSLVDQFTVVYTLCALVTTNIPFVLNNGDWWERVVDGFANTLEGLQ